MRSLCTSPPYPYPDTADLYIHTHTHRRTYACRRTNIEACLIAFIQRSPWQECAHIKKTHAYFMADSWLMEWLNCGTKNATVQTPSSVGVVPRLRDSFGFRCRVERWRDRVSESWIRGVNILPGLAISLSHFWKPPVDEGWGSSLCPRTKPGVGLSWAKQDDCVRCTEVSQVRETKVHLHPDTCDRITADSSILEA